MEHMLRPKAKVLPDTAVVPERNWLQPPPNQFTHVVEEEQPYYYAGAEGPIDGTFAPGTKVVLLFHDGGPLCHVADGRGLYVATPFKGIRQLGRRAV